MVPPFKIIFYVQANINPWVTGMETGHGFVQLLANIGPQAGDNDLVYGHYPNSWNVFYSNGLTESNADHPWNWRITFPVTAEQFNKAKDFIMKEKSNPSDYALFSTNCVWWIAQLASQVGLSLPEYHDGLDIPDPKALAQSLSQIGDGGTYAGGTVQYNTAGTLPNGTPDPAPPYPDQGSVDGFVEAALADPASLAQGLNLAFQQETLNPVSVGVGQSLTVSLANVDLANALVVVDFADGTPVEQLLSASHTYQTAGTRQARAIVINSGAVDEFSFEVDVGSASGTGIVSILAADPPANEPFPTIPAPPDVATIPTTTVTVTSSINPSGSVQSVIFTATVSAQPPAADTPTGIVTFQDGGSVLGIGEVTSGVATFTTSSLTAGMHSITSVYGGDTNFAGSSSAGLIQTVTLGVTTFAATSTGFQATFNGLLNSDVLNLYDNSTGMLGPADVTLKGAATGAIRGSLVVDQNNTRITFIETGQTGVLGSAAPCTLFGVLPSDTYTVTLRSATNGFQDTNGNLLDGNGDGTAGGDFVTTFVVSNPSDSVTVTLPDFARAGAGSEWDG